MIGRPANQDMADGYLDGRNPNEPEPSSNRSYSYRHGFAVGRSEIEKKPLGHYSEVLAMAEAAMAADDQR